MNADKEAFIFDEGSEIGFEPRLDVGGRWKELPHLDTRTRGFILIPGETIESPDIPLTDEHRLRLDVALGNAPISSDGLRLNIAAVENGAEIQLGTISLTNDFSIAAQTRFDITLAMLAGRTMKISLTCDPGPDHDPAGDWVAICAFIVARSDELELATASSQYQWRARNEIERFANVYAHEIYGNRRGAGELAPVVERRRFERSERPPRLVAGGSETPVASWLPPAPGETAFAYANRMLGFLLPNTLPDFAERLVQRSRNAANVKLLSLCAGEAGIEGLLLRAAQVPVDVTLMDINPQLLERARFNIPNDCTLRFWEGDVRDVTAATSERFDVIMFVAALHHVVYLEEVLEKVASMLAEDGELWLVGEQVGRNGNRLWPDAYRVANQLFESMPERLRVNSHTGAPDATLPNTDFASSCFEGIRSQEILHVIRRKFVSVREDYRNCFMWRFVESTYGSNFKLENPDDLHQLRRIVAAEYDFWRAGGLSTELNGVYRLKVQGLQRPSSAEL